MGKVNIEYAWKDNVRYHISDPFVQTGDRFDYIDGDYKYEVCPHKGKNNAHSFHSMPLVIIDADRMFHKNCQYYIQDQKKIETEHLIIYADKVLLEAADDIKKNIPDYSMIPDCVFLDADGNIICIVEVFVTHAKDENDKIKINNYKINTIELNYGKSKNNYKEFKGYEWLYIDSTDTKDREKRNKIQLFDSNSKQLEHEINEFNRDIERLEDCINEEKREIRDIDYKIQNVESGISRLETSITNFKAEFESERRRVQSEITRLEMEISSIL